MPGLSPSKTRFTKSTSLPESPFFPIDLSFDKKKIVELLSKILKLLFLTFLVNFSSKCFSTLVQSPNQEWKASCVYYEHYLKGPSESHVCFMISIN
jgi:hypothetical protein